MSKLFGGVTLAVLIVLLIAIGPIFTIMALNTLFPLDIPLTVGTWCAALWLGLLVKGATNSK